MAKWKKVLVSGSKAQLTEVTASVGLALENLTNISDTTAKVLVIENNNVKTLDQSTISGQAPTGKSYATMSIKSDTVGTYHSLAVSASGAPEKIEFVKGDNINVQLSSSNAAGSTANFVKITASTSSVAAGDNVSVTPVGSTFTVNAATSSVAATGNATVSQVGSVYTVNAVTKSLSAGDNITISNTAAVATINAATSSVAGTGNISVSQVGNVFTVSSTATTEGADANFANITASGNISASDESGDHHFGGTATFGTISASQLNIQDLTQLNTSTTVNGSFIYNGLALFEDNIIVRSGSTIFGSGSMPSEVSHQFTGSVKITGSLTTGDNITAGTFTGDGSGLTNVTATSVDIDGLSTAGTTIDQTDLLIYSDAGDEKKITFSNLEDQIFSNMNAESSDVSVAAGGAIQLTDDSVGVSNIATAIAGTGLTGGGGNPLSVDLDEVAEVPIDVANDYIAFIDTSAADNDTKKESVADLAAFMAGTGLDAASGVFNVAIDEVIHGGLTPDKGISSSLDSGVQKLELGFNTLPPLTEVEKNDLLAVVDITDGTHKQSTIIDALGAILGTSVSVGTGDLEVDFGTIPAGTIENDMMVNDGIIIGTTDVSLGDTITALVGLTDLDLTAGSHTIFDTVGANTLTMGASDTTISVPGALTVAGNFTVQGTTTFINTETLTIDDNFIDLNSNFGAGGAEASDAPDQDAGLSIKRGSAQDANFFWDEAADRWALNLNDITGTDTQETPTTFITSTIIQTANPGGGDSTTFGADANTRQGEMWVNKSTEEIWIYA